MMQLKNMVSVDDLKQKISEKKRMMIQIYKIDISCWNYHEIFVISFPGGFYLLTIKNVNVGKEYIDTNIWILKM